MLKITTRSENLKQGTLNNQVVNTWIERNFGKLTQKKKDPGMSP